MKKIEIKHQKKVTGGMFSLAFVLSKQSKTTSRTVSKPNSFIAWLNRFHQSIKENPQDQSWMLKYWCFAF